jgi:hypothetical protein
MPLTSAGIRNEILRSALADLVGKPFADASVAFIPTASVAAVGDHGWFVDDLSRLRGIGWREAAAKLDFPIYALDDDSAVRVRGSDTDVVSDGAWRLFNSPTR